jgi:hypothetical protein
LVSDVVLGKAVDEDGAQRLVLAMVGCGIGIQEEPLATNIIHGCPFKCEVVFRVFLLSKSYQNGSPRPSRTALRASEPGKNRER